MSRRLVLWRHGRTQWNLDGRTQGQSDVDLDDVGRDQAAAAAPYLAELEPAAVISSDLRRARHTAAELGRLLGVVPTYDHRLRELDFGVREGLTVDEATARWPAEMAEWRRGRDALLPGAERLADGAERFVAALRDTAAGMDAGDLVVVVTHGSVLRVGTSAFVGLPAGRRDVLGSVANCHWSVLREAHSGWRIEEWNVGPLPAPDMLTRFERSPVATDQGLWRSW